MQSRYRVAGLWLEWLLIFISLPLVIFLEVIPVSKLIWLIVVLIYTSAQYLKSRPVIAGYSADFSGGRLALRMLIICIGLFGLAYLVDPAQFLLLPRQQPLLWILISLLYPLVSALPQEFVYRRFYFWRYQVLFKQDRGLLLSSMLLFSFLHIVYDNTLAVLLTLAGGYLFASSYARTRSLFLPWLEHAVYGVVIFTSGLGRFFYEPMY